MSISSEISRISGNVSDALTAISNKGVTVPSGSNSDDLAYLISQITGGGTGATTVVTTQDSHGGDIVTITTGIDISNDTVAADKLLYGYTAHNAAGQAITGTYVPSGTATLITKSITENGTYNASSDNADGYSSVTVTVPDAYTLTDVSNTTGTTAQITAGNGGGGGATQHEIHLEFSDSTDEDIDVYYDDSLIGTMITAYAPTTWTYNSKTVILAQLDDVTWYDKTGTWETLWDDDTSFIEESGGDYPYCWISALGSTPVVVGDEYRVTFKNVAYRVTAFTQGNYRVMGNPKYVGGTDDGSGVPFMIVDYTSYGAWTGNFDLVNTAQTEYLKIEHLVTS